MMAVRITKADINRYTEGDCHVLAREIHRLTGWPFHCFVQKRKSTLHAFVEMPDGRFLDVEGPRQPDEFYERWEEDEHRAFNADRICRNWWDGPGNSFFGKYSAKRAKLVAQHLVECVTGR